MYREDKSSELAQRCADYLEDRSYGSIATTLADYENGDAVIATLDGTDFEIVTLVYDEQNAPRLHCELALTIQSPEHPLNDYADQLCGYTFQDDIWYECDTDDDADSYLIRLFVNDYNAHKVDDIASLVAVNFIPVMQFAAE